MHRAGTGGDSLHEAVARLLPTPDASPEKYRLGGDSQQSRSLPAMAIRGELGPKLLPTVKATNNENRPSPGFDNDGEVFHYIIKEDRWGQYADAIARWEHTLGRPAPAPTEPTGRNGAHRLSPRFTEWMMGVPDGWITDTPGLTRNEALKACGNGVVPQQAYAAIVDSLTAFAEVAA